ncbi:MAG TPA: glycine--tRNA ligase subunit beta [Fimbriimonadaceae bacterium]|jgi:glycyl-tRNA synthetase beta chain
MPELVLELGCEELPASFVRKAYTDLESAVTTRLKDAGIPFGSSQSLGTPRRLIIQVTDVAARQPDVEKEQRGPGIATAYDADGNPTKALEGFCRGQGVSVNDLRKEGDYVWVTKTIPGKPTNEVLAEILPAAIRGLTFDKAMRWGNHRFRFARPIRWILAAFGNTVVRFDIDGIESGDESRGHRFYQPETFKATGYDQLLKELRSRKVEPDPALREKKITEESVKVTRGEPQVTAALLDENVFLTEWPTAIEGSFKEEYLKLPVPVLITAMAKHERFFPVQAEDGKLTNRFVSIRNGGVDEVVSKGNSWVLNARFNDAKFFYDEDLVLTLDGFLEKTKGIFFQEKLGTVHQRALRLTELAHAIALATGASADEADYAAKAGLYAKADLSTGLVSELPALQGLIGAEYAKREGFSEPVCWAIASQYDLSKNPTIDCEGARTATRLVIADQLDKLAGYFGIGQVPSGSSDPYGLRRAATLLIEAALRWPGAFPSYKGLFEKAQDLYQAEGFELASGTAALSEVFLSRYNAIFADSRHDLVDAAIAKDYTGLEEEFAPQLVRFRISVMEKLGSDVPFIQTATRPQNIVSAAVTKGISFAFRDPLDSLENLQSEAGSLLGGLAKSLVQPVSEASKSEDADLLIKHLKSLEGPINTFFDSTMVMAEDENVRAARLSLLHGVNLLLRQAGDFSRLVISGD